MKFSSNKIQLIYAFGVVPPPLFGSPGNVLTALVIVGMEFNCGKNYLFAGSHRAARGSGMLYSLLGTCKIHEVNPYVWLKEVQGQIAMHPVNKVQELLPRH